MKKIVVGIVVCLIVVGGIGGYFLFKALTTHYRAGVCPPIPCISFSQNATEEHWNLTVAKVETGAKDDYYDYTNVKYYLSNSSGHYFHGNLSDIRNKPCSEYNITWLDKDDDYKVSFYDEFIISKTGGNIGKALQGDTFRLVTNSKTIGAGIGHVVLQ